MRDELHRGVAHGGVAEDGGDEFSRAVRLVSGAESAGNHEDLRAADGGGEFAQRVVHIRGALVAENEDARGGPGFLEGAGAVIFAVAAGEDRDEDARRGAADGSGGGVGSGHGFHLLACACGEGAFEGVLPGGLEVVEGDAAGGAWVFPGDVGLGYGVADGQGGVAPREECPGEFFPSGCVGDFEDEASVMGREKVFVPGGVGAMCEVHADTVAKGHFGNCRAEAALADAARGVEGAGGLDVALVQAGELLSQQGERGQAGVRVEGRG